MNEAKDPVQTAAGQRKKERQQLNELHSVLLRENSAIAVERSSQRSKAALWNQTRKNRQHPRNSHHVYKMSSSTQPTQLAIPLPSGLVMFDVWRAYRLNVPRELQVIDAFLCYVLTTGIAQFVYGMSVGSFPFNSFLAGFLSCVGVFVLTVSLRMQLSENNRKDPANRWMQLSRKRAVADWLFCNLILHMAVLNFLG